jgi:hypothetical protein
VIWLEKSNGPTRPDFPPRRNLDPRTRVCPV